MKRALIIILILSAMVLIKKGRDRSVKSIPREPAESPTEYKVPFEKYHEGTVTLNDGRSFQAYFVETNAQRLILRKSDGLLLGREVLRPEFTAAPMNRSGSR